MYKYSKTCLGKLPQAGFKLPCDLIQFKQSETLLLVLVSNIRADFHVVEVR
jgi:hypothetical protein